MHRGVIKVHRGKLPNQYRRSEKEPRTSLYTLISTDILPLISDLPSTVHSPSDVLYKYIKKGIDN
uniref:Uncharacterized protein n=1 Tax=Acinetobacter phage vB_Ab_1137_KEN_05 TaxID=3143020 RepID=A0AAU8KX33_9VIRU